MYYSGKLIGLVLGVLFTRNFFGALIGLTAGHLFDEYSRNRARASKKNRQNLFFYTTFQVMGHLSKSKGRVTESDIQIANDAMDKMYLDQKARIEAQSAFRQGKRADFPLRHNLRQLRRYFRNRSDLLSFFLEVQLEIAFSESDLHPSEKNILYIIAEELGIKQEDLEHYFKLYSNQWGFNQNNNFYGFSEEFSFEDYKDNNQEKQQLEEAYKLLGVSQSDDMTIIKRAYRKLMNLHHPDKLLAKGLPPELTEMAKQKCQNIQSAYDIIRKEKKES